MTWTTDEIELLKHLWCTEPNKEVILDKLKPKSLCVIKIKANSLKLKRPVINPLWTIQEDNLLRVHIPKNDNSTDDILKLFSDRTWNAITKRYKSLGVKRGLGHHKRSAAKRIRDRTRDLSPDKLEIIASRYSNYSTFLRDDSSAVSRARTIGILDKITSHMVKMPRINFPQRALYEIVKLLLPNKIINYNDRKTIGPKELDIYIPSLKIAFEYDGLRYHSDDSQIEKDSIKDQICLNHSIKLYRIKETSVVNPIPSILKQLQDHGFNTSEINVENISQKTGLYFLGLEEIRELILKYDSCKNFESENYGLYQYLRKSKLMHFLDPIRKTRRNFTYEDVKLHLEKCKTKLEFRRSDIPIWVKFEKLNDLTLNSIYNSLPN